MSRVAAAGCAWLFTLTAVADSTPQSGPLKTIEPADIVELREVSDPQISPDGKRVVYTVLRRVPGAEHDDTSIWIVSSDGSAPERPLVFGEGTAGNAKWSPDGRAIAFLSDRANPLDTRGSVPFEFTADDGVTPTAPAQAGKPKRSRQLWLLSLDGGEAQPLTRLKGDIADLQWSPDGTRIALLRTDPPSAEERKHTEQRQDAVEVDAHPKLQRVWIYDLRAKRAQLVSPPDIHVSMVTWSPDSARLALRTAKTPDINAHWYRSNIAIFDIAAKRLGDPIFERAAAVAPAWSPDGQRLALSEIFEDGIAAEPRIYDLRTRQVTACGKDYLGLIGEMRWDNDGRTLLVHKFEKTRTGFARLDPRTCNVEHVADAFFIGPYGFSASAAGKTIAYVGSTFQQSTEVWVMSGKRQRVLTRTNPHTATWNLGHAREVSWTASDGKTIYGVLVTPPGHVAGTPVKTVVQIHGGPEWAWWSGWHGSWHEWAQMLASHGYAVFMPNPRGSDGQGTAFARLAKGDWGGADFQDVLDGIDALVKQRVIDPARLGIGGWSYGGFMSAWAVTHSNRFKAAVVGAAPVDVGAMALTTDTPDFITGYYGDPFANHAQIDAHSPIRFLDRTQGAVLILHGEQDTRVPVDLGEQMYVGLRFLNKPVTMVRYPREPHWMHEYEHHKDLLTRVLAWFDQHI